MSKIPHKAKRDKNEPEIIDALKTAQCTVQRLNVKGAPDLLVGFVNPQTGRREMALMEVKHEHGRLTPDQIEWRLWWNGQEPVTVRCVEDALRVIGRA